MLENYIEGFNSYEFVREFQKHHGITKRKAMQILRRKIPNEPYYQKKIKDHLEKKYGRAIYVRKVTQGPYSEGGIADLLVVHRGRYIGFEVKRPVVGEPTKLQLANQELVAKAGGVYAIVTWPEEAEAIIEMLEYLDGQEGRA